MKIRFLADADLNKAIVTGTLRREPSIDFLTAQQAGLLGMRDRDVLALPMWEPCRALPRIHITGEDGHGPGAFPIPQVCPDWAAVTNAFDSKGTPRQAAASKRQPRQPALPLRSIRREQIRINSSIAAPTSRLCGYSRRTWAPAPSLRPAFRTSPPWR